MQDKVCTDWPIRRKIAIFDKVMSLNQVEGKSLSLEKANRDGATVKRRAMYVEMSVAKNLVDKIELQAR